MSEHRKFRPRAEWLILYWQKIGGGWTVGESANDEPRARELLKTWLAEHGPEYVRLVYSHEPAIMTYPRCGWRGFAGSAADGCVRALGHTGKHGFADGSGEQD